MTSAALLLAILTLPASDLEQKLTRQLASAPNGSRCSVAVYDITGKAWLSRIRADTPRRLASVTKLYVAAGALLGLGEDYQFRTSLHALGRQDGAKLDGLGVIGRGSPCMDEHHTDKQPDRIFIGWAAQLKRSGITQITGDIIIDTSFFAGPAKAPTWPQDHLNQQKWYSAPASAFAYNDNCIEVRASPGKPGKAAIIHTRPRSRLIGLTNRATSVSSGGSRTFLVSRAHRSNHLTISGKYSKTTSWFPVAIHDNADQLAGDHLKAILAQEGIRCLGKVRIGPVSPHAPLLLERKDSLKSAITILNQRSQNFYGEQIIRVLGKERGAEGSAVAGVAAMKTLITSRLNVDMSTSSLLDGSGLSYDNLASAATTCHLLAQMHGQASGPFFMASMKEKWHGKTRCRVKTGSLAVARCLAGYVPAGDRVYAFAILLNKGQARSIGWASIMRDKLFQIIAAHR